MHIGHRGAIRPDRSYGSPVSYSPPWLESFHMMMTAEDVIAALGLEPHPLEGGFFRETYRTPQKIFGQERSLATAIYYLLTEQTCSRMHRLPGDELFHF